MLKGLVRLRRGGEIVRTGSRWLPTDKQRMRFSDLPDRIATNYWCAKQLGLTSDPPPDDSRYYLMVQWNDWPGAVKVCYADELEIVRHDEGDNT